MQLFNGLKATIKQDEPLAPYTWYRLGGPADYLVEPDTVDDLQTVVCRCQAEGIPVYVLGSGANLLVADGGVRGVVIRLSGDAFRSVELDQATARLTVGAGADMGKLVLRSVHEGFSGLEPLTGIPGTIGGCVRMNAGGAFGDIGSVVDTVTVMTEEGEIFQRHRSDLVFGYRSSNINSKFILSATFQLAEDDPHRILKQTKEIWIYKRNTQPFGGRSAGCVFKNPRGMSAGALVDKAGMKGRRVGGAQVSEKHANFIIAHEGATAFDVLRLIDMCRDAVAREFGVNLEKEIDVW